MSIVIINPKYLFSCSEPEADPLAAPACSVAETSRLTVSAAASGPGSVCGRLTPIAMEGNPVLRSGWLDSGGTHGFW